MWLLVLPLVLSSMIIIIIALKGSIQDFLQSPHCTANCLQCVYSSGQGAIVCKSHATHRGAHHVQHVMCHVVRKFSSAVKFGRVEIAFILALFYWLKGLTSCSLLLRLFIFFLLLFLLLLLHPPSCLFFPQLAIRTLWDHKGIMVL